MKKIIEFIKGLFKYDRVLYRNRKPKYSRHDIINISIDAYLLSKCHGNNYMETLKFIKWVDEQLTKLEK